MAHDNTGEDGNDEGDVEMVGKMTRRARIRAGGTAIAAVMLLPLAGARLSAAIDPDEMSDVVEEVLVVSDVGQVSEQVRNRLIARLMAALDLGVVDERDLATLGFGVTDDSVTPSTERDRDMVRDQIRERLREQQDRWSVIAPEWRQAMEQLRERLAQCQDSPTQTCQEQNRLELQYRHAERVNESFEQRLGEAGGDPEIIRELERQRERAQLRIETMLQNGDAETLDGLGIQTREMEQLRTRLQQTAEQQTQSTVQSSTQSTTESSMGVPSTTQERQGQP